MVSVTRPCGWRAGLPPARTRTTPSHSQGHSSPVRSSWSPSSAAADTDSLGSAASVTPSRLANSSGVHALEFRLLGLEVADLPDRSLLPHAGRLSRRRQFSHRSRPGLARSLAHQLMDHGQEETAAAPFAVLADRRTRHTIRSGTCPVCRSSSSGVPSRKRASTRTPSAGSTPRTGRERQAAQVAVLRVGEWRQHRVVARELRDSERHIAGGMRAGDFAHRQPRGRVARRARRPEIAPAEDDGRAAAIEKGSDLGRIGRGKARDVRPRPARPPAPGRALGRRRHMEIRSPGRGRRGRFRLAGPAAAPPPGNTPRPSAATSREAPSRRSTRGREAA